MSESTATARLVRRFAHHAVLRPEEKQALETAATTIRRFAAGDSMAKQGAAIDRIFLIVEGFACRARLLPDGRRQIAAFLLPGDLCDTRSFVLSRRDHSISALSPVEAALLSEESVQRLERLPSLGRVLAWNALVQQSISREWLVNVGHRTAFERLSHLLCELFERLQAVGLTRENSCHIPLTQIEIADTIALSSVHVNRTLMELRRSGLVTFQSRQLTIHNYAALRSAAGFDPTYLHLERSEPVATTSVHAQ